MILSLPAGAGGMLSTQPGNSSCPRSCAAHGLDVAQHPWVLPHGAFQLKQLGTEGFLAVPQRNKPRPESCSWAPDSSARDDPNWPEGSTGAIQPRDHPLLPRPSGSAQPFHVQLHCSSISEVWNENQPVWRGQSPRELPAAKAARGTINLQLEQHKDRHSNIPLALALL